jgi:outer membrane protein OmpA-like peptidoglycan-associated protein
LITGHTDGSKTETNSKNLSQNRAKAVYDFLIEAGIDSSRIRTEALGNRQLAVSPKVKGANEKNRRAEITILKME